MFNNEERDFLLNIIKNLSINPLQQDAAKIVDLVNGIFSKLSETNNNGE